jgi:integrase
VATLQLRNDSYRVLFCAGGRRYTFTLGKVSPREAENTAAAVDQVLLRIEQRLLRVPDGADLVEFVKNGGQLPEETDPAPEPITLRRFQEQYLETHRGGAMEKNSLATVAMHLNHFGRTLGERFPMQTLSMADLQRHVNTRARKKYRGHPLSPVTLRKEMASLRAAWNWAALTGLVTGPFPSKGLVYPKTDEKPPFMTWAEIERKAAGLAGPLQAELWDCLYLTHPELDQLLGVVKERAAHPWVYPLFCFAAHTGARRSEVLRVLVADVDFDAMTVMIREKKRSRRQRTTRRVPLTPFLAGVLKEWLKDHPGGPHLFCHRGEVGRSKKRSKTTGHRSEKVRPSSLKGRLATVRRRELPPPGTLTKDEAHDHLKRTLAGTKWAVLRGYHVLRHSFISLCASGGVDQRLIDEWVGHQTEEQRKRYRHLLPSTQQDAIRSVFRPAGGEPGSGRTRR